MKNFVISCGLYAIRFGMSLIYFFIKLFPIRKNKVTMLSRQSDEINIDFELLLEEMQKHNLSVKVLCKMVPKNFLGRVQYCFYIVKCLYHIATSKVCIVDGYNIPISALKHKKGLVIIQIWHAMGAIKQFGNQVVDKKEGTKSAIAKIMKMHHNYDYVLCVSEKTKEFYEKAFKISKDKILTLGMPRIDYLLGKSNKIDEKVEKLLQDYPKFRQRKNILYVPTFRKGESAHIYDVIKSVDTKKYNLIIRLHPLEQAQIENKYIVDKKYKTFELLKIADYVITDYSAVAFEACVLEKQVFFYLYDIKQYQENRGLNISLQEEMPHSTSNNIKNIIDTIENDTYNYEEYHKFKQTYVETVDTENTHRIVSYILKLMEEVNGKNK